MTRCRAKLRQRWLKTGDPAVITRWQTTRCLCPDVRPRFDANRTDAVTEPRQTRESRDVMQIEHECAGKAIWHYRIPRLYLATLWNVDAICCGSGVISPSAPCSSTKKSCCHQRSGREKKRHIPKDYSWWTPTMQPRGCFQFYFLCDSNF